VSTTQAAAQRSQGTGAQLGFESQNEETPLCEIEVEGTIPAWLQGELVRTGPAKFEVGDRTVNHWFDGLALLHRFEIDGGKVTYASRFLEGKAYEAARDRDEISYSEFATDPCRTLFGRVMAMFSPSLSDNGNVNLVKLGERWLAMTETPIPVEFDGETLATAGVAYEVPGMLTTAHPHLERADGGVLNYAAKLGPRNAYRFFHLAPDADEPRVVAELKVREPAYMHSFGLSERWIVLAEFPLVVNPLNLAFSGRPYIENYRWKPELGTRITLIDRTTGEATEPFVIEPFFSFHHVNAYEEADGSVVVDLCAFDDAGLIEDLYLDRLRSGGGVPAPKLRRCRLDPATGQATTEVLLDPAFDLPRINYGRCNERPYRYVWGVGVSESGWLDRIVKADLADRTSVTWGPADCYAGEPVFVAEPGAEAEDAGVLLSVVLDATAGSSFLAVLDAATLTELARATVPRHIPFGFHGQFAPA
jgi:beta,beta-carotene 9',10'-dioxygenase